MTASLGTLSPKPGAGRFSPAVLRDAECHLLWELGQALKIGSRLEETAPEYVAQAEMGKVGTEPGPEVPSLSTPLWMRNSGSTAQARPLAAS